MTGRLSHARFAGVPSGASFAVLLAVALEAASAAGCLCPPCPGTEVANAGDLPPGAPAGPVAVGARQVLWDGDGAGAGAQGWDACDPKAGCSKVGPVAKEGVNGSAALDLHGDGPGYLGMGWNLFGWYPENAGYDITPYSHLTFQIRVKGKTADSGPEPGSVNVLLGCSRNKNDSASVPVERYAKGFSDGKWHKVEIPISAFLKGSGAKFDAQSFWEFRIATWSASPKHFDIYVDELALEKH